MRKEMRDEGRIGGGISSPNFPFISRVWVSGRVRVYNQSSGSDMK